MQEGRTAVHRATGTDDRALEGYGGMSGRRAAFGVSFQIGQTAGVTEKGQNQSKVKEERTSPVDREGVYHQLGVAVLFLIDIKRTSRVDKDSCLEQVGLAIGNKEMDQGRNGLDVDVVGQLLPLDKGDVHIGVQLQGGVVAWPRGIMTDLMNEVPNMDIIEIACGGHIVVRQSN